MKRLTELWMVLAHELGKQLDVDVTRDIKTATRRVEHEGESFFFISLPKFCGDFESSLESGEIAPTFFQGFRKNGRAPAFLRGFLALVFDLESGRLQDTPLPEGVAAIRQLTTFAKKTLVECSSAKNLQAYESYLRCDEQVGDWEDSIDLSQDRFSSLYRIFRLLYSDVLQIVEKQVEEYRLEPKHGPGACADRRPGNRKWDFPYWPLRWTYHNTFPFGTYVASRFGVERELNVPLALPSEEHPVKVVLVPKTHSTPRVIAEEPDCMMYMQQAMKNVLVPALEEDSWVGPLIGFTDQSPNREMARVSSIDRHLATLDLSEASDRVSNLLVQFCFSSNPSVNEALQLLRSDHANVNGKIVAIRKFASMGSALCFPVEAMVFLAIVCLGIEEATGRPLNLAGVRKLRNKVRVYGDDIVCPRTAVQSVTDCLEYFGLVVNKGKSFSDGNFRESCGGDFYAGVWVTPIRVRRPLPVRRTDVRELVSWASTMNQCFDAGLWQTSEWIRDYLEGILGPLPVVPRSSQALGLHSFMPANSGTRMSPTLHVPQTRAWVTASKIPVSKIDGYHAMAKCFRGDFYESRNRDHLNTAGRPSQAKLIKRWVEVDEMLTSIS